MLPIDSRTNDLRFMQVVLSSRLGSCWRCLTSSLGMLVVCALGCSVSAHWGPLLDSPGSFGISTAWVSIGAIAGTCLFGLLTLAHLILLAVRSTMVGTPGPYS